MRRNRDWLAVLAAALVAVALALGLGQLHVLDRVEDETIGLRFQVRGAERPAGVTVVAIDETTFTRLREQWPFPRSLHAKAIDRLVEAGARTIVYDVQFTEPTRPREDLALFEAVGRAGGVVLAATEIDGRGGTDVLGGSENLAEADAQAGAANLATDAGGEVRRFPYSVGGLRSLAVTAAEQVTGKPVDRAAFAGGDAWIDYAGPRGTVPTVSFSDLLERRADVRLLRDRIVVVGATAATLQDLHATPLADDQLMSGPEVQANAISTALQGLPLREAPGWLGLIALLGLGLVPALARLRLSGPLAGAAGPAAALAYLIAAQLAFEAGWIVSLTYPLLAGALGTVATVAAAFLIERRERGRAEERNDILERRVRERTQELRDTQLEIVRRLGQAAELRDESTGAHIERIRRLCHRLALEAGLPESEAELIGHASAMHDVGKIGVPDRVLLKPAHLDADEWKTMQAHTTIGAQILGGSSSKLLQVAESIALTHHERWDGGGYPAGLGGEDIPLPARICAICDVYDALTSERPYKRRWTHDEALEHIARKRGAHFDPALVDAFMRMAHEIGIEDAAAA
jgi:CHASE2 domain-containing sensor protein